LIRGLKSVWAIGGFANKDVMIFVHSTLIVVDQPEIYELLLERRPPAAESHVSFQG
jgi:hypothetical protein